MKIGDKVKIVATESQLREIRIFVNSNQWKHGIYKDRNKVFTITEVEYGVEYGGINCPYQLDEYSFFPKKYLKTLQEFREEKLKKILNERD